VRRKQANFVKLLDFGLAKLVEKEGEAASTSLGMTFGEPKYMSPEQARGDPVDRRADIYSLGCIAYEMLVGEPPFTGKRVFDILSLHVEAPHVKASDRRPDIPPWFDAAVDRMLAKRADDRFATVFRLVEALRQGRNSGKIMPSERATRRETDPPPSVVKAMQLMADRPTEPVSRSDTARGLGVPGGAGDDSADDKPEADFDPRSTKLDGGAGAKKEADFDPRSTKLDGGAGAAAGAVAVSPPPDEADDDEDLRETGKRDVDRRELERHLEATGKHPDDEGASSSGISAAWYADGDKLEGDEDLDASMQAKLKRARSPISPSKTDVAEFDDDFYEPERSRLPLLLGVFGAIVVIVVAAVLLWPSEKKGKRSSEAGGPGAEASGQPSTAAQGDAQSAGQVVGDLPDAAAGKAPVGPGKKPTASGTRAAKDKGTGKKPPRDPPPRDPPPDDPPPDDPPPRDPPPRDPPPRDPPPDDPPPGDSATSDAVKEAEFFAKLGNKDLRIGDILGAASNFKKARELDPKNLDAVVGLGEIALSQGSYSAAIGHLTRARKLRSKSARVHTLLGEAYLGAGNNSKAADSFKRALKIDPDNARARDGYNEASGSFSDDP